MRAIRVIMFFLVFLSVALAQSTVEDNWRITSLDMNGQEKTEFKWLTGGCFQAAVQNLNTEYKRDFEISMLGPANLEVTSIAEWKYTNEPVELQDCTESCNPWQENLINGSSVLHGNCSTSCYPYSQDRYAWRWKPSKMFLIDGKSSTQKSDSISIGKSETKLFRICADIPIQSSGKFDVGVYDINAAKQTLLDPWWNSSWAKCRNITTTPNPSAYGAYNFMVDSVVVNGLTYASASEIAIVNASCGNDGTEIKRMIHSDNGTAVNVSFILNQTLSSTPIIYSIYYNNTGGTGINLTGYLNETNLEGLYHFEEGTGTTAANNLTNALTDGTLVNTPPWDTGYFGGYSINYSSNGYLTYGDVFEFSNGTLEFWVWLNKTWDASSTGEELYLFNTIGGSVGIRSKFMPTSTGFDGKLLFQVGGAYPVTSRNSWSAGWHHIVFQWGRQHIIWADGVLELNSTALIAPTANFGGWSLGMLNDGTVRLFGFNGAVDEVRFFDESQAGDVPKIYGNVSIAVGAEETADTPEIITITIHHPDAGITYLNNTKTLNFTVTSSLRTSINVTIEQNSTKWIHDTVTNNTVYTIVLNMSKGAQTVAVYANTTTESVSFNTIYENVTSSSAVTPTFEATNTTFNISIESVYGISNVRLSWNGTYYNATAQNVTSWYRIQEMPVVYYNNTNVSYFWNFTIGAQSEYQNWTASATQLILYAYDFNVTTAKSPTLPVEGQTVEVTSYILNHSPRDFLSVWLEFNGTTYTSTFHNISQNNLLYKTNISIPAVPHDNYTLNFSHNFSVTLGPRIRYDNLTDSITIRIVNVTVCPNLSTEFLQLVAYEEENNTQINFINYEVLITYWTNISLGTRQLSIKNLNVTNVTFCMSPSTTITLNLTASYQDALKGYSVRSWYFVNRSFNSTLHQERLYLLPVGSSFYVDIAVSDAYGVERPGITVKMQRYFYDETLWRNVQVGLTDQAGAASVYLVRYDVPYRFALYDGQNHLRTYTERTIDTSPLSLKTAGESVTIYNTWFGVNVGCDFINATKIMTCTVTDRSGKVSGWRLKITEQGYVNPQKLCDNVISGTSGTITCDLSAFNVSGIFWTVYMTIDGFDYRVVSGSEIISYPEVIWGETGALVAMMMVLMAAAIGMWNPAVGMLTIFAGVVLGSWSGIFPINPALIVAMGAVVALMIYRMKA